MEVFGKRITYTGTYYSYVFNIEHVIFNINVYSVLLINLL